MASETGLSGCCLNVRQFGATVDDAADDTLAIQAALDALTPRGGCVCLPPGTYLVSRTLVLNAPIQIQGAGDSSIVKATAAGFNVFALRSSASGSRLTSFQIQGAAKSEATGQTAIYTEEKQSVPVDVTIDHMLISGPDSQTGCNNGVLIDRGANDWTVIHNHFSRLIGTTSGHGYGLLVAASLRNIVTHNRFTGLAGQGRHAVYLSTGASFNIVAHNIVTDFNFEAFPIYSQKGQLACAYNQVADNTVVNHYRAGESTVDHTHDTGAVGIYGVASHNAIKGNVIVGYLGHGIIVTDSGSGGLCVGNQIVGNSISEVGLSGIMIMGAKKTDVRSNAVFGASQDVKHFPPATFAGISVTSFGTFGAEVCDGTNVASNTSWGQSQRSALRVDPSNPAPVNLVILGNKFLAGATPGTAYELNGVPCVFDDNVFT